MARGENKAPEIFEAIRAGDAVRVEEILRKSPRQAWAKSGKALAWGWEPAHWAAALGKSEMLELLIRAGANLNAKDAQGHTPVHLGALYGHPEILRKAALAGAEMSEPSEQGLTPMDLALSANRKEASEALRRILESGREKRALERQIKTAPQDEAIRGL